MSEIWHLRAQEQGYVLDTGFAHLTCFVGKSGLIDARHKHEGDGATPKGQWAVRGLFYRPDIFWRNLFIKEALLCKPDRQKTRPPFCKVSPARST